VIRLRLLLIAGLLLLLTGCQVSTTVDITTQANGAGSINVECVMDAEATTADPNLAGQLNDSDLKKDGWSITGPDKQASGGSVLKIHHKFSSTAQANVLMAQLTGVDGPFKAFTLSQDRSLTSVQTRFSGTVDFSNGVSAFGSAQLTQRLGQPLGFDVNQLQSATGTNLTQTFPIQLDIHIPGKYQTVVPERAPDGTWHLQYGAVTNLKAVAKGPNVRALAFLGAAIALVVVAIVVALVWRTYKPQHTEGGVKATDFVAQMKEDVDDSV
jgi:hypothetical protein